MKSYRIITIALSLVLMLAVSPVSVLRAGSSTDSATLDREFTALRGTWESKTFYEKWTFLFTGDKSVIIDGEDASYQLLPGVIRISDRDGSIDYKYTRSGDAMSVTSPDGTNRTYTHAESGLYEKDLVGRYLMLDSTGKSSLDGGDWFRFDGLGGFELHSTDMKTGVYRVEGDNILLTYSTGAEVDLSIANRDEEGTALRISSDNNTYDLARILIPVVSEPTLVVLPYDPPVGCPTVDPVAPSQPPVYYPMPTGGSSPGPTVTPAPASSNNSPRPEHVDAPRTFGSTRSAERRP